MPDQPDNIIPITPDARTAAEKFGAEHDRELLTILFTDLVDSTRLQFQLGNVEAARLTELHRKIVREELAKYDAREIEWAGDSCLAVFTKPSDAVVFALRMQAEHRRIRESEKKLPTVRVGMHLGEIVVKKRTDGGKKTEDLFGLQVSEAARVMSVARGDQIFCTRAVFDNARSALKGRAVEGVGEAVWVNYGAYLLKGSDEPVELCEIGSADVAVLKAPETNDKVAPIMPGGVEAMRALIPYEGETAIPRRLPGWAIALTCFFLVVGGLVVGRFLPVDENEPHPDNQAHASPKRVVQFGIDIGPAKQDDTYNVDAEVAASRDGTRIAYVVQISDIERRLFIRDLTADTVVEIQSDALVTSPFFSPDGEWVGYSVSDGSGLNPNHLMKVPVRGGAPTVLCESLSGLGATWLDDDTIVFAAQDEDLNLSVSPHLTHLFQINASGGIPERLTKADGMSTGEWSHNRPFALPDNRGVVFAIRTNPTNTDIALLRLDSAEIETLATNAQNPQYAPSGHITFVRDEALWAIPFDLESLEVVGEEALVQSDVQSGRIGSQAYAITSSGDLVYAPVLPPDVDRRGLVWVDLNGDETNIKVPLKAYTQARISRDGTRLALTIGGDEFLADASIWLHDLNRPNAITQLTNERSGQPVWLPDGRRLVYGAFEDEAMNLYVRRTDGLGDPEPLLTAQDDQVPLALTPSGDAVLIHFRDKNARNGRSFRRLMIGTNIENVLKRPVSERRPFEFLDGEGASNWNPVLSPNEKWVAYLSYSSNTERQTFVRPYPFVDAGRWQVSTDRGGNSHWAPDGSALYYWNEGKMMVVKATTESKFTWETPRVLFEGDFYEPTNGYHHFDIHPDGNRFLMIEPFPELNTRKLTYVENWTKELERLVPHPEAN
jgi:serine/threonine-protein kinase